MRSCYLALLLLAVVPPLVTSVTLERKRQRSATATATATAIDGTAGECVVETRLRRDHGLIIRDRMPDEFDGAQPCRTTLKSPEGKPLKVKVDVAILNGKRDFLQITVNQNMWYIDKTCAPCHEEIFEGFEFTIEFLLTNQSRFQVRYSTNDSVCPFLKILPPLVMRSQQNTMTRKVGSSFQLECLTSKDYKLIGESQIHCEASPNGSASWSAPLPTCHKISNCPELEKVTERSGRLQLRHQPEENYHCSWQVDAADFDASFIEFIPRFSWHNLGHWEAAGRNRGLAFYDGEGRLKVDSGVGLRYRTRDPTLKIYFNLSAKEHSALANASFALDYEIWRKNCPTIDEESFPFGTITLTDTFFVGSSAKFHCATGYKLVGKSDAVCLRSGDWNFQTMPECVPFSAEVNDELNFNSVSSEETSTSSGQEASRQRQHVSLTTERDVLSYTGWSVQRRVTTAPVKHESNKSNLSKSSVANSTLTDQKSHQSSQQRQLDQSEQSTTTTVATNDNARSGEDVDVGPQHRVVPTLNSIHGDKETESGNDRHDKVALLGSFDAILHRLQTIDLSKRQDVSYLLILITVVGSAVLIVILLGLFVRRSCKEKIPLRENPMYTGAPARRIQNVSFRPNGKHKKAAQQRNYS